VRVTDGEDFVRLTEAWVAGLTDDVGAQFIDLVHGHDVLKRSSMDNLSEFKADKMAAESVDGGAVDTDAAAVEVFGTSVYGLLLPLPEVSRLQEDRRLRYHFQFPSSSRTVRRFLVLGH